mgnify:CR=1 FL=1
MSCHHSRPAWRSTLPNKNGEHPINFTFRRTEPDYFIPCGRCDGCRASQRRDWAIRIAHESQSWDRNCFVTLTYDDQHCPESIQRSDCQNFIKRLKRASARPIRYYLVGEYGDKTRRPHYHAILFNEDFLGGAYDINGELYGNKILDGIWRAGNCTIAPFTFATAMYTAGYVAKKTNDSDTFSLQSQRPPLGKAWVREHHDNIRRNEKIIIEGKEMPIPAVYHNWLKGTETFNHIKENLQKKIQILNDKQLKAKRLNFKSKNTLRTHTI